MKIVHIITRMIVGGASEIALAAALGEAGVPGNDVTLVTGPETGAEGNLLEGFSGGIRVVTVPSLVRSVDPGLDARALLALRRFLRIERPDVVHTHSSKAGVLGRVAARTAGVSAIVHTFYGLAFHDYQAWWVNASYRAAERSMAPFTTHFVSDSHNARERAIAAGIGRPERHSTVRGGFGTQAFIDALAEPAQAREALGLPEDRVVIGVVGRLFALKGHDDVLAAAARVVKRAPEALFAFVGGGPLRPELERRAHAAGLDDHVRFIGRIPPEEIPSAFSAFDILAHASLREGLARVYPQAVLAGVPVVTYRLDGAPEVIRDGINGYLIEARDVAAFADRLTALVRDAGLRTRLGGVGCQEVRDEFSVEQMVTDLERLYGQLVAAA